MLERLTRASKRVRQTVTGFDNGPAVLTQIARRSPDLVFKTDNGLTVACPNVAGARVPVYEIFVEDAYRLDWFTGDLGPELQALDIGGHIGCFSMAFATLHPNARVQTFEASPSTYQYTRRNIETNRLDDRVAVENVAVSSSTGTLSFADNQGGSGLNGITAPEGSKVIEIPCVTFAEAKAHAGGSVDVVKIDTEGAEYDIVLGSDPADWKDVQRVVLEYHDVPGYAWSELKEFFASADLHVVRQEPVTERLGTAWLSRTPLPA
jgi:FkbM family methyltransferase